MCPLLSGYVSKSMLKAIVRAYMNVGLPVIIGITLAHEDESFYNENPSGYIIGNHAVTINGYRLSENIIPPAFSDNNPLRISQQDPDLDLFLLSSRIDKFYSHDDQIGPFSSMEDRSEYWQRVETRWNYYRNMWVVDSFIDEDESLQPIITFIFDATDMDSSDYLILALHHRRDIFDLYCAHLSDWSNEEFDNYISGNRKNIAVLKSLLTSYRNGNPAEKLWHS